MEYSGRPNEDIAETAGNNTATKTLANGDANHAYHDTNDYPTQKPSISEEEVAQIQKINHDQYNYINKLEKDLKYWQQKCVKLTIDHQCAEFDLKKAKRVKGNHSKENKILKDQNDNYESVIKYHESELTDLKLKKEILQADNEELQERMNSVEKVQEGDPEQEIINRVISLPDIQSMSRVLANLNMQVNQKYYSFMMNQQKSAQGDAATNNGAFSAGDQNMNGMYYMQNQMMNMNTMQYNTGMYQNMTNDKPVDKK
jgi:hypothetical protein